MLILYFVILYLLLVNIVLFFFGIFCFFALYRVFIYMLFIVRVVRCLVQISFKKLLAESPYDLIHRSGSDLVDQTSCIRL